LALNSTSPVTCRPASPNVQPYVAASAVSDDLLGDVEDAVDRRANEREHLLALRRTGTRRTSCGAGRRAGLTAAAPRRGPPAAATEAPPALKFRSKSATIF
jgi:hypothetical protein